MWETFRDVQPGEVVKVSKKTSGDAGKLAKTALNQPHLLDTLRHEWVSVQAVRRSGIPGLKIRVSVVRFRPWPPI